MANKITPEHVYKTLKKNHPEKYKDLALTDIDIYASGAVRVFGKFAPGFTGNAKGRTVHKAKEGKSDLTAADLKKFGSNAKKALEHLLETSSTRKEAKEISKILVTYQAPKLANIESRSFQHKTIEVKWAADTDLIDITPEDYEKQQLAAKLLEINSKSPQGTKK